MRSDWGLASNSAIFGDPLKGAVQTLARPGAKWTVTMYFDSLGEDERAELAAFLVQLRGHENRAKIYNHAHTQRGYAGGTPLVAGSSQTGTSLTTDGWSGSNPVLRAGDYFAVNGELKMITSDANHSGGSATLNFEPALRASPPDNDPIDVSNPEATFVLRGPDVKWSNRPADLSAFTIEFIEAFS
jgi:hypothetical protein